MAVIRIVPDIAADDPEKAHAFYGEILGLDVLMDQGWVKTFGVAGTTSQQITVASQGGSDQPVPAVSIEVDDLDAVLAKVSAAGMKPTYGPTDEPWGVRRFFIHDPFGTFVNILQHT